MALHERLNDDLKTAMRAGDAPRRSVLRYLLSAIHNQEIEKKGPLDDEAITALLGRQAQQRRDSIEAFSKGGRDDLVAKEEAELALIVGYLPQQLTDDEVRELAVKGHRGHRGRGPAGHGPRDGRADAAGAGARRRQDGQHGRLRAAAAAGGLMGGRRRTLASRRGRRQ